MEKPIGPKPRTIREGSPYPKGGDLLNVVYDEAKQLKSENSALVTALEELIPIAEFLKNEYPIDFFLYFKESAIERAKKYTDGK
jgi:hypothetical protein